MGPIANFLIVSVEWFSVENYLAKFAMKCVPFNGVQCIVVESYGLDNIDEM